jgi:hypothetical protein
VHSQMQLKHYSDTLRGFTNYSFPPLDFSIADIECFINHESTRKFLVLRLNMSDEVEPPVDMTESS